ncbi:cytochrome c/FTR1 family iron permease [Candidatus Nitrosacidococcus tergens]|uniref:Iron permease FTR1 n=1 Tax=Candidatus Nitrosacidococcus tergens TaxID=553981 RepID=A0A7G1Q8N4_9GAMM|nr:cytochrome c/FTR1 family iron permease [Candidatus Nitrosacidococcus tergens]CAB1275317.1 Iron permease FTR1 [Candidatus Nitrosacidococcus tergens]
MQFRFFTYPIWLGLFCYSIMSYGALNQPAQNALHMLDYISVDYPTFVQNGQVLDEQEYQEQQEFSQTVVKTLKTLPDHPEKDTLLQQAQKLVTQINNKEAGEVITTIANKIHNDLIQAYHLEIAPKNIPDIAIGKTLYQEHCANCHGVSGNGKGPNAESLDPLPTDFSDKTRQDQRSIYSLFNTLTLGVSGTAMPSFQENLSEDQRWAIAFFVSTFSATEKERSEGKTLWQQGIGKDVFTNLQILTSQTPKETKTQYGEQTQSILAYLRSDPNQINRGQSPLEFSQQRLKQSLEAYQQNNYPKAQQLAIEAYLEGFELIENNLDAIDSQLRLQVEQEMMAYRQMIHKKVSLDMLEQQYESLYHLLEKTQQRLQETELSTTAVVLSALTIIVREGLEAVLVIGALLSVLIRTQRRDGLLYVHAGWITALIFGGLTWLAATYFIKISGASREVTEGIAALIAMIILLYVGFWLHSKTYADGWQRFISKQVQGALNQKTLWALASLSFLAVYREAFETVLFYEALLTQVGIEGKNAVLWGFITGTGLLIILSSIIFYSSIRLPLKLFFSGTSTILALLAVILAGKGISALQEAGWIPLDSVTFPTIPLLGVYPNWQGLSLQAIVLALILLGFFYQNRIVQNDKATQ